MKGFGAFVDFASSADNKTTTLWFESKGVPSLGGKLAASSGSNLFWGIFLFIGEQWNVLELFLLNSLVLYWLNSGCSTCKLK
jgi:hypothetical protein